MVTDKQVQQKILKEIIKVKHEIIHIIEGSHTLDETEDLKNTVNTLKEENRSLKK